MADDRSTVNTLTKRQRGFVLEYLRHGNATRAAESQGYSNPARAGSRMRRNKKILAAIEDYFREQEMSALEVVARLSEQARAAYSPYLLPGGTVDLDRMLGDGVGHLIKGFRYSNNDKLIVEFYDAQSALVHIGRYHAIFTDGIDHHGAVPITVIEPVLSGDEAAD